MRARDNTVVVKYVGSMFQADFVNTEGEIIARRLFDKNREAQLAGSMRNWLECGVLDRLYASVLEVKL